MKTVHTYVCLVDNYRRYSRQRNTKGRYLVGAKDEKEARELLQNAIKFGSVNIYYRATDENGNIDNEIDSKMKYKEIKKVQYCVSNKTLINPRMSIDPIT